MRLRGMKSPFGGRPPGRLLAATVVALTLAGVAAAPSAVGHVGASSPVLPCAAGQKSTAAKPCLRVESVAPGVVRPQNGWVILEILGTGFTPGVQPQIYGFDPKRHDYEVVIPIENPVFLSAREFFVSANLPTPGRYLVEVRSISLHHPASERCLCLTVSRTAPLPARPTHRVLTKAEAVAFVKGHVMLDDVKNCIRRFTVVKTKLSGGKRWEWNVFANVTIDSRKVNGSGIVKLYLGWVINPSETPTGFDGPGLELGDFQTPDSDYWVTSGCTG